MMPYIFWTGISEWWYKTVYEKYDLEIKKLDKCGNYFDWMTYMCIQSRYHAEFYGKKMNLFESFIVFCASLVMNRYSKKTYGSEAYVSENTMVVAMKK